MSKKDWEAFFALLEKIVNMPDLCASEKGEKLIEEADSHSNGMTNLQEIAAWIE
jgi:hypothetical protein